MPVTHGVAGSSPVRTAKNPPQILVGDFSFLPLLLSTSWERFSCGEIPLQVSGHKMGIPHRPSFPDFLQHRMRKPKRDRPSLHRIRQPGGGGLAAFSPRGDARYYRLGAGGNLFRFRAHPLPGRGGQLPDAARLGGNVLPAIPPLLRPESNPLPVLPGLRQRPCLDEESPRKKKDLPSLRLSIGMLLQKTGNESQARTWYRQAADRYRALDTLSQADGMNYVLALTLAGEKEQARKAIDSLIKDTLLRGQFRRTLDDPQEALDAFLP